MVAPVEAPRVATIEGRRVLVVDRRAPLPPTLALLLNGGRDTAGRLWPPLRVASRQPLRLGGTRAECLAEQHRMAPWLAGIYLGSDRLVRSLQLTACQDCGAVCVRDVSVDTLDRIDPQGRGEALSARRPPRRKDHVIGWFSGARPDGREYR